MNIHYHLKQIVLCSFMAICSQTVFSQVITRDAKRVADGFYRRGDYFSAIQYYEQAVNKGKNVQGISPYQLQRVSGSGEVGRTAYTEMLWRLGESYRLLNDYKNAATWYGSLSQQQEADAYPLTALYYGIALRANGNYEQAENTIHKFLTSHSNKDEYHQQAKKELADLTFIRQQRVQDNLELVKLGDIINKQGASYAAAWLDDKTVLFTSTRSNDNAAGNKIRYVNTFYVAPVKGGNPDDAVKLALPPTGNMEQGAGALSTDGNTLVFTGWFVTASGVKSSALYTSMKNGNEWSKPVLLPDNINMEGYSARQPFITEDGKYLFFASDRPGGKGGFDIWYAPLNAKGAPGKAVNAGAAINSKGNEETPFYHGASKTLVFASDGRVGMGGYDLYAAEGVAGNWGIPRNLGAPVNSVKDDLYFISRGGGLFDNALLSSDRASQCCLELFALTIKLAANTEPPVAAAPPAGAPAPLNADSIFGSKSTLVTRDILFGFNESSIDSASFAYLNTIVEYMQAHPGVVLEVGAHTDGKGSVAYNLQLSQKRADACVSYLAGKGIDASRLRAKGYGKCCPLEKETSETGEDIPAARERNRRLEIKAVDGNN